MKDFFPAKKRIEMSPGESLCIMRELQELSLAQLSELTGIPEPTISAIESGHVDLSAAHAKQFARALKIHPTVLLESIEDLPHDQRPEI